MALAVAATEAAAGLSRSEHWNVNTHIPLARQRENPSHPDVPCERRTSPADPTQKPNPTHQSLQGKLQTCPIDHQSLMWWFKINGNAYREV